MTQLPLHELAVEPTDVVYVDPPYAGSAVTYAHQLAREDLLRWISRHAGPTVVSEAEPLPGASRTVQLTTRRLGTQLSVGQEWVSVF